MGQFFVRRTRSSRFAAPRVSTRTSRERRASGWTPTLSRIKATFDRLKAYLTRRSATWATRPWHATKILASTQTGKAFLAARWAFCRAARGRPPNHSCVGGKSESTRNHFLGSAVGPVNSIVTSLENPGFRHRGSVCGNTLTHPSIKVNWNSLSCSGVQPIVEAAIFHPVLFENGPAFSGGKLGL